MSDKDDNDKLWDLVKNTIQPLRDKNRVALDAKNLKNTDKPKKRKRDATTPPKPSSSKPAAPSEIPPAPPETGLYSHDGIDKKNWQRFIKGKHPIDATLDLHGLTQSQAHDRLIGFINGQSAAGNRFVLIITGKGKKGDQKDEWGQPVQGILRKNFKRWIEEPALKAKILKVAQAQQHHGGAGAFYVLLKRQK